MSIRQRCREERGASLVEYALMVALVAVVCLGAITFLGEESSYKLETAANYGRSTATFDRYCDGERCSFTAPWSPSTLHYMSYEWKFGDGTTSNDPYVIDHYFEGGKDSYSVTLTSRNQNTDEVTKERITCTRNQYTLAMSCN